MNAVTVILYPKSFVLETRKLGVPPQGTKYPDTDNAIRL